MPQFEHTARPVAVVYRPATHCGQAALWPVTGEYVPAAQPMQLVEAVAPAAVRYSPAAHAVQADKPYCPTGH